MATIPNPMWGKPTRLSVYPTHCADAPVTTDEHGTRIAVLARSATVAQPFDRWNADASQLRERLALTEEAAQNALVMLNGIRAALTQPCQRTDVKACGDVQRLRGLVAILRGDARVAHELARDGAGPIRAVLNTSGRKS